MKNQTTIQAQGTYRTDANANFNLPRCSFRRPILTMLIYTSYLYYFHHNADVAVVLFAGARAGVLLLRAVVHIVVLQVMTFKAPQGLTIHLADDANEIFDLTLSHF